MPVPGAGADLFWQEASSLQLPGITAKPACAHCQGHSQEGEMSREAEQMTNTEKQMITDRKKTKWITFSHSPISACVAPKDKSLLGNLYIYKISTFVYVEIFDR